MAINSGDIFDPIVDKITEREMVYDIYERSTAGKPVTDNINGVIYFSSLRNSGDALELEKATKSFIKNNGHEPQDNDVARDYSQGALLKNVWNDIPIVRQNETYSEFINYPTQKPEALLERIIKASSNPGDLVFDCFMGSGTTQAVAMKLGRRFLGADINMGAIQTTTKRLINRAKELNSQISDQTYTPGLRCTTSMTTSFSAMNSRRSGSSSKR